MRRARRYWLLLLVLLVAGGMAVILGARWYLGSQHVVAQVAAHLEAAYGGKVEVAAADVGLNGTSLSGLQLFQESADQPAAPWAVIDHVEADVSLWDVLRGQATPRRLTLKGAAFTLHFDRDGQLLTELPRPPEGTGSALPEIQLSDGQVTLHQDGRAALHIRGIDATLQGEGEHLTLDGTVADPYWGDWTAKGSLDPGGNRQDVTLRTAKNLHVNQEKLERLPFVSPSLWKELQLEGDTPVELNLQVSSQPHKVYYRIKAEPEHARVRIPAIDLMVHEAAAKVVVEDKVVRLTDAQAQTAGGTIEASGQLDFQAAPSSLQLDVKVQGLELRQLPDSWALPAAIDGRLNGSAKLQIRLVDDGFQTSGAGKGVITDARVGGQPAQPIQLRLHADRDRFRFVTPPEASWIRPATLPLAGLALALQVPAAKPVAEERFLPTRVIGLFHTTTMQAVQTIVDTGSRMMSFLGRAPQRPAAPQQPTNYVEASLGLEDVDLAQLVTGLGVALPFRMTGRLTVQVRVGIPLNSARDLRTYRLNGTATLRRFTLEGLELEQVKARFTYAEGVLKLEELQARVPPEEQPGGQKALAGTFRGTAQMGIMPPGELTAQVTLETIPVARVLSLVPAAAGRAAGAFSGTVQVRAPTEKLNDLTAWHATGSVQAARLRAYGLLLERASADLRLEQGTLSLSEAHVKVAGAPMTGSAQLRLVDAYPFQARVQLEQGNLAVLQQLAPELRPPISIQGTLRVAAEVKGTLEPFTFAAAGTGSAAHLRVEGLKVDAVRFAWESTADRLRLKDVRAALYGGELTGSAVVPLRAGAPGSVEVRFQDADVGALTRDVSAVPVRLEGRASGSISGALPAAEQARDFTAQLDLSAPQLRVQGIPTERLKGAVSYRQGTVEYRLEGQTLGGRFHLNGQLPPGRNSPPGASPEGRLEVEGVRLDRLWQPLGIQGAVGPLQGTVNLVLTFRHEGANRAPVGSGQFTLSGLRWGGADLGEGVRGMLRLTDRELRVQDLSGSIGQGLLRGQAAIHLTEFDRSWFSLALEQVEAARLVVPWPALAGRIEGALQVRLRGQLGREWFGTGLVVMDRGTLYDVEVVSLRLPIDWAFAPDPGRGQVEIRETSAQAGLGRLTGRASLGWGVGSHMEGHLRFYDVELRSVLRSASGTTSLGSGRVTGRFDFQGTDVRSLDDVTGILEATLGRTQAFQMPVLRQVAPYILPGQSATGFHGGAVRARLARGILRIERLTLEGNMVQLFIQGDITLAGRLALDVWARTRPIGVNPVLLRRLGLRLPVSGPVPIGLVLEVSNYLSNRLIHLRVTGTIRSPTVQIDPAALLTEEAVRYFVNRLAGPLVGAPSQSVNPLR